MAGREIKEQGAAGAKLEGADDSVKSNDKKAADTAWAPKAPKEQDEDAKKGSANKPAGDPSTPAQYEF